MPTAIVENVSVKTTVFLRHSEPDGTIDSICPICYRPIASARSKKDVMRKEKIHMCNPNDLSLRAQYGPF